VKLSQPLGAELVDPLLGAGPHFNQPGLPQDPQVFGRLRLIELQPLADLTGRLRPGPQELDDAEAIGLGESCERFDHGVNITK
jgi:hypothetical protein